MKSIRRVLIVHPYGIGDLLFVTPILRALRLIPTVEKVDLLLGSRTKEMIESNPHINEIYVVDKDRAHRQSRFQNFKETLQLGLKLRKQKYDLLIDFSLRREYAFAAMLALGIRHRLGLDYKGRAIFHTKRLEMPNGFCDRHVTDYYADLVEMMGIPVENRNLELYLLPSAIHKAGNILAKARIQSSDHLWVIAPGGGESWGKDANLKRWPVSSFANLINQLADTSQIDRLLIIGSTKEKELAEELIKQIKVPYLDLTGQLTLMQTAAIIDYAGFLIANDGGLVHIAHALRKPTLAFYGPASPTVYGPYPKSDQSLAIYEPEDPKEPCYQKFRYRHDCQCLSRLSVEHVLEKIKQTDFLKHVESIAEVRS